MIALKLDVLDTEIQAQLADPSRFGIKHVSLQPPLQQRMDSLATRVCVPVAALAGMHPIVCKTSLASYV